MTSKSFREQMEEQHVREKVVGNNLDRSLPVASTRCALSLAEQDCQHFRGLARGAVCKQSGCEAKKPPRF